MLPNLYAIFLQKDDDGDEAEKPKKKAAPKRKVNNSRISTIQTSQQQIGQG